MKSLQIGLCVPVLWCMAAFTHLCLAKDSGASLIPSTSSVAVHKLYSTLHTNTAVINCFSTSLNFLYPPPKKNSLPSISVSRPAGLCGILKKYWESMLAGSRVGLFRWLTMSFASPISPKSEQSEQSDNYETRMRKCREIKLPNGDSAWPRTWHKSAASCFCVRCFNLIKSRLMMCRMTSLELQTDSTWGGGGGGTLLLLLNTKWNIGRKQSRLL